VATIQSGTFIKITRRAGAANWGCEPVPVFFAQPISSNRQGSNGQANRLPKKPRADVILSGAKDLLGLFSIRNSRCFVRRGGLSMTDALFQQPR
jgi:hypothetical protein